MLAIANKLNFRAAACLLLLSVLSACANRGGLPADSSESAQPASASELGIETSSNTNTAEAPSFMSATRSAESTTSADNDNASAKARKLKPGQSYALTSLWSARVGGDDDLLLHFRPALDESQVCAAGRAAVSCFQRDSGERQWRRKVRDLSAGVSLSNDLLLVGTDEGEVIALSRTDGSEQWRSYIGGEVLALLAIGKSQVGEVVVAYSSAGNLSGLRVSDGETIWVQEQKVPRLTMRGLATPVVVDGIVVAGHDNGRITANKLLDGSALWADELVSPSGRNEIERLADIDGAIAHYRGDVFAASIGGKVGAWSLRRGRALWRADISSVSGVAADLRRVYVSDLNSALYAIDARSGRVLWKQEDVIAEDERDSLRVVATTVLLGQPLLLDNEGQLYYYQRSSGELLLTKRLPGDYATAPAVLGNAMATLSRAGQLRLWQMIEAE